MSSNRPKNKQVDATKTTAHAKTAIRYSHQIGTYQVAKYKMALLNNAIVQNVHEDHTQHLRACMHICVCVFLWHTYELQFNWVYDNSCAANPPTPRIKPSRYATLPVWMLLLLRGFEQHALLNGGNTHTNAQIWNSAKLIKIEIEQLTVKPWANQRLAREWGRAQRLTEARKNSGTAKATDSKQLLCLVSAFKCGKHTHTCLCDHMCASSESGAMRISAKAFSQLMGVSANSRWQRNSKWPIKMPQDNK